MRTLKMFFQLSYKRCLQCVLCLLFAAEAVAAEAPPNAEQMAKLVAAIWKKPPVSLDVTAYIEKTRTPMSVEKIRSLVEKMYELTDADAVNTTAEARKAELEAEVQRIIQERQSPRIARQRIRLSGYLMRIDEATTSPGQELNSDTPYTRTIVNGGNPLEGDHTHFEYNHVTKIATIYNTKKKWRRTAADEWQGMAPAAKILFQVTIGALKKIEGQTILEPKQASIEKAIHGTHDNIRLSVEPKKHGNIKVDQITVVALNESKHPVMILLCDRHDYARVYRTEVFNPKTGQRVYFRECDEFDDNGFPRLVNTIEYSRKNGAILRFQKAAIETGKLNVELPKELFEYSVPPGYGMVDRRLDNPIAVSARNFDELDAVDDAKVAKNIEALPKTKSAINRTASSSHSKTVANSTERTTRNISTHSDKTVIGYSRSGRKIYTMLLVGILLVVAFFIATHFIVRSKTIRRKTTGISQED